MLNGLPIPKLVGQTPGDGRGEGAGTGGGPGQVVHPAASNVEYLLSQGIDHLINAAEKDVMAIVEINRLVISREPAL